MSQFLDKINAERAQKGLPPVTGTAPNTSELGLKTGTAATLLGAADSANSLLFGGLLGEGLGTLGHLIEYPSPFSGEGISDNDRRIMHEWGYSDSEIDQMYPHRDSWLTSLSKAAVQQGVENQDWIRQRELETLGDNPSTGVRAMRGVGTSLPYFAAGTGAALSGAGPLAIAASSGIPEALGEGGSTLLDAQRQGKYDEGGLAAANKVALANIPLNMVLDYSLSPLGSNKLIGRIKNPIARWAAKGASSVLNETLQEPTQDAISEAATNSLNNGTGYISEFINSMADWPSKFAQLAPEVGLSTLITHGAMGFLPGTVPGGLKHEFAYNKTLEKGQKNAQNIKSNVDDFVNNPTGDPFIKNVKENFNEAQKQEYDNLQTDLGNVIQNLNSIGYNNYGGLRQNLTHLENIQRTLSNYGKTANEIKLRTIQEQQRQQAVAAQQAAIQEAERQRRERENAAQAEHLRQLHEQVVAENTPIGANMPTTQLKALPERDVNQAPVIPQTVNETPDIVKGAQNNTDHVRTSAGTKADIRYRVMEADDLITSNDDGGKINPAYKQEYQGRRRSSDASQLQIARIANAPDPELLGKNPLASDGAPIIDKNRMVISGNGRTLGIRKGYKQGTANGYRAWITQHASEFGLDPDYVAKMKNPVLVREITSDVKDMAKFANEANESSVTTMSATDRAKSNAELITAEDLLDYDFDKRLEGNRKFISNIIAKMPANDKAGLIQSNGNPSAEGIRRVKQALIAKAYNDTSILDRLMELPDDDNEIAAVSNGLEAAAPQMAKFENSNIRPELSLSEDVKQAVNILANLKENGETVESYLTTLDAFDDTTPEAKKLLEFMGARKKNNRYRTAKAISQGLINYAQEAMQEVQAGQGTLTDDAVRSKGEILDKVLDEIYKQEAEHIEVLETRRANRTKVLATKAAPEAANSNEDTAVEGLRQNVENQIVSVGRSQEEARALSEVYIKWEQNFARIAGVSLEQSLAAERLRFEAHDKLPIRDKAGHLKGYAHAQIAYENGEAILKIAQSANQSSILHEFGHLFLTRILNLAKSGNLKGILRKDFDALLAAYKMTEQDLAKNPKLFTEFHERFATDFERYMRTGKAPSKGLKHVFEVFKRWLKSIYERAKDITYVDRYGRHKSQLLSKEAKQFFNYMLGDEVEAGETSQELDNNGGESSLNQATRDDKKLGKQKSIRDVLNIMKTEMGRKNSGEVWVDYARVSPEEAKKISDATGLDINDKYVHTLMGSSIIHTFKRHDTAHEAREDQVSIDDTDIERIPDIIKNADEIHRGNEKTTGNTNETIVYQKRINGHVLVVEEVRNRRGKLAFHTMRKTKAGYKYDLSAPGHPVVKENAKSQGLTSNNAPQPIVGYPNALSNNQSVPSNGENVKNSGDENSFNQASKKTKGKNKEPSIRQQILNSFKDYLTGKDIDSKERERRQALVNSIKTPMKSYQTTEEQAQSDTAQEAQEQTTPPKEQKSVSFSDDYLDSNPDLSFGQGNESVEQRYKGADPNIIKRSVKEVVRGIKDAVNGLKGSYAKLQGTDENGNNLWKAKVMFDQLEREKHKMVNDAMNTFATNLKGLTPYQFDLFRRKRLVDDLKWRIEDFEKQGKETPGLPYGWSKEVFEKDYAKITAVAERPKNKAVMDAVQAEEKAMRKIALEFVNEANKLGIKLGNRFPNPHYYRHLVLEYAEAATEAQREGKKIKRTRQQGDIQDFVDAKLKSVLNRSWLKKYKGSDLDISSNYVQAMGEVRAQMLIDTATMRTLSKIKEEYDIAPKYMPKIKKALEQKQGEQNGKTFNQSADDENIDINELLPDGYSLFSPAGSGLVQSGNSISENAFAQAFNDISDKTGVPIDDILTVAGLGVDEFAQETMILPQKIKEALRNMAKRRNKHESILGHYARKVTSLWKADVLYNPLRNLKYNLRNFTGDLDALISGAGADWIKYTPKAFKDLSAYVFKGAKASSELQDYLDRAGGRLMIQTVMFSDAEIAALEKQAALPPDAKMYQKAWAKTTGAVRKFFAWEHKITEYRENLLRYTAYLMFLDDMDKNNGVPTRWAASNKDEILAIADYRGRAYEMANDLLGAYDKISDAGKEMRSLLMPFWSWQEVNCKRYARLLKNGFKGDNNGNFTMRFLMGKTAKIPYHLVSLSSAATKIFLVTAMMSAFNAAMGADDDLPEDVKYRPHITFGKWGGKVWYFDRIGALADALDWFSLDSFFLDAKEMTNGQQSLGGWLKKIWQAPFNKAIGQLNPYLKMPIELATGRSLYPNMFQSRQINDRLEHVARSLGVEWPYKELRRLATNKSMSTIEEATKLLLYSIDPEEAAYFNALDKVRQFNERVLDKHFEGFASTKRGTALRNMKTAMRYKDYAGVQHFLREYRELDGTPQGLKQSMKAMNPLFGMNEKDKKQFMKWITPNERKSLRMAERYWKALAGKYIR